MTIRPRLSPTIDRFLMVGFLGPFGISLAAFSAAYLMADVFDRFNDLVHYGGFGLLGSAYFLLKLPLVISQLLPVACLAGALLGFAILNRSGEVLACQGLGISRLEMGLPILIAAAAISLADFGLSETVVPVATRQARYLYTVRIKKRTQRGVFANRGIWMRLNGGFLSADSYDRRREELRGVTVFGVGPHYTLHDISRAQSALWDGRRWRPRGLSVWRVESDGAVVAADDPFDLQVRPGDLDEVRQDPEEFSLAELNHYVRDLRRKGLDPGGYLVDRDLKCALPAACLIMVALAVVLSLDPLPRKSGLSRSFTLGVAIGFGYWVILGFTSSFGRSGLLAPWVAAWLPNFTFTMLAASIFMFGEER